MNLNNFLLNLTLLFIYLQLAEYVEWSWWKVLSPLILATSFHTIISIFESLFKAMRDEIR